MLECSDAFRLTDEPTETALEGGFDRPAAELVLGSTIGACFFWIGVSLRAHLARRR
jgi:hypothetical protein